MASPNLIVLLINSLALSLSVAFLLIILWYDVHKIVNQFFALFLFLAILWNIGSFIEQIILLIEDTSTFRRIALSIIEVGFIGACVGVYSLTTVLIGIHPTRFRLLAFLSLSLVIGYNAFLIVTDADAQQTSSIQSQAISIVYFIIFDLTALYLIWRYRPKLPSRSLAVGIIFFISGQGLSLFNLQLGIATLSTVVSVFGILVISFSLIQVELINPLNERVSQVEAMHSVSLAITKRFAMDAVLLEVTRRAVSWLNGSAAGVFLIKDRCLQLVAIHELPEAFLNHQLSLGEGVAGQVVATKQSLHLDNYARDWSGKEDFPMAKETVGSIVCVPLVDNDIIGALMLVAGRQQRLFVKEDVELLEQLGSQVAVAVSHGRLFDEQTHLANELKSAHEQLNTLLNSTTSPVIATNRQLQIIFSNPAAGLLLSDENANGKNIEHLVDQNILPKNAKKVLMDIRDKKVHIYEVNLDDKIYYCHLAQLGVNRIEGWVAVLNDVTQFVELDRMKSEMIRMTSHDLKNPLQAAMANIELLRDDLETYEGLEQAEVFESIDIVEKQLNRMNRIISGILDLERAKLGQYSFNYHSPESLIEQVLDELQDFAQDKQIYLHTQFQENLPLIYIDFEQFKRALINLIENAIKFTMPNGYVWIKTEKIGDQVQIEILDNGIGIPEELHAKVFDRFFRGKQDGMEHISGSGLGLSLVKTIVENHGGRIRLESEENKGSSFCILLSK